MLLLRVVAIAGLLVMSHLLYVAPAAEAARKISLAAPAAPLAGERFTVSGKSRAGAGRVVQLQIRSNKRWVTIKSRRTASRGTFTFTMSTTAARTHLRVRDRRSGLTSNRRTVRTVKDQLTLRMNGTGTTATAMAQARPARVGRRMVLQRRSNSGAWVQVGPSRAQPASGKVTFALTDVKQSAVTYRLLTNPWRGAAGLTSAPATFAPSMFNPTTFGSPVLRITTADPAATITKEHKTDAAMTIDDGAALPLTIKGRGNSTWKYSKKPYRLALGSKASLLGMPADKNWVLLANYGDRSLVRTSAALDLGAQLRLPWTPRQRPVEVILNGEYLGAYQLTEHVRRADHRIGEDTNLFEIDERLEANELDGDEGFRTSRKTPVMLSDPDEGSELTHDLAPDDVREHLDAFEDQLATHDFAAWSPYVDVDSFVDFYLAAELFKSVDADCFTSCFFTWSPEQPITMGPLWDFDHSIGFSPGFGYLSSVEGWWANGQHEPMPSMRDSPEFRWLQHMWETPAFRTLVRERWQELRPVLDAAPANVTRRVAELGVSAHNNWERWAGDPKQLSLHVFAPTYAGEVAYVRDWLTGRIAWLDAHLDDEPAT